MDAIRRGTPAPPPHRVPVLTVKLPLMIGIFLAGLAGGFIHPYVAPVLIAWHWMSAA